MSDEISIASQQLPLNDAPLGKRSAYVTQYQPALLYPIPRQLKRQEIAVPTPLPFTGFDTWNAYEVSWLNPKGKPVVMLAQFDIACDSVNLIESKSFKLYLNSFNHSVFSSADAVKVILQQDIARTAVGSVHVTLHEIEDLTGQALANFSGECIDAIDVVCDTYTVHPAYLSSEARHQVTESLISHVLKSNCLVTGQPDWGSLQIAYHGPQIDRAGLLKYIVSFRNHPEFHEQCVERIFMHILQRCHPTRLTVHARYTRRGGLDINPVRSTHAIAPQANIRMARQ